MTPLRGTEGPVDRTDFLISVVFIIAFVLFAVSIGASNWASCDPTKMPNVLSHLRFDKFVTYGMIEISESRSKLQKTLLFSCSCPKQWT